MSGLQNYRLAFRGCVEVDAGGIIYALWALGPILRATNAWKSNRTKVELKRRAAQLPSGLRLSSEKINQNQKIPSSTPPDGLGSLLKSLTSTLSGGGGCGITVKQVHRDQ